jgi:glycine/D-amino acid oxidase-like deaminating enzyme
MGDRPRPRSIPAPIIGFNKDYPQVIIATGHYRNGVLMAPITAEITKDLITKGDSDFPYHKEI